VVALGSPTSSAQRRSGGRVRKREFRNQSKRATSGKACSPLASVVKDLLGRIEWLKVAKHAGGLAFSAFTGIPILDQLHAIVGTLQSMRPA
jgi:hypothetical protein